MMIFERTAVVPWMITKFFFLALLFNAGMGDSRTLPGSTQYSVEILVVVDEAAYQQWSAAAGGSTLLGWRQSTVSAINNYIQALFAGINVVMSSLKNYGVQLDVRILSILHTRAMVTPSARDGIIQGNSALDEFGNWLKANGYSGFDHALLLTGLTIADGRNVKTEGIAYMGTMCKKSSLSVVESKPNQHAVLTAAHELGHSLNASHDGRNNGCSLTAHYVMSEVRSGTSLQRWSYSACSAASIKRFIENMANGKDCLSPRRTRVRAVRSRYLGQLYSPDEICRMSHGPSSYVCRSLYADAADYNKLCLSMLCSSGKSKCTTVVGTDGTVCGRGKRCLAGKCITFSDGPTDVSDSCPLGDTPVPISRGKTCSVVMEDSKHNCKSSYFHNACCQSCEAFHTGRPECPYGDASSSCRRAYCTLGYADQCCVTCGR